MKSQKFPAVITYFVVAVYCSLQSLAADPAGGKKSSGAFQWQVVPDLFKQAEPNTGYIATAPGQVTIQLPAAPPVGSTIRVTGSGSGGWKINLNPGQSISGQGLGIIGANWVQRESERNWRAIASAADGTKLVALDGGGYIYTSTDAGVTWTPRESPRNWWAVASSGDGTKLIALEFPFRTFTSVDSGATWTPAADCENCAALGSSADGSKLIAGGYDVIYTSTDFAQTWTPHETSVFATWSSVASSADGNTLLAEAGGLIRVSRDSGLNWDEFGAFGPTTALAMSQDGQKMAVATAGGSIYISWEAGQNWMPSEITGRWSAIASSVDGTKLIALQLGIPHGGEIFGGRTFLSNDSGKSWIAAQSTPRSWRSVRSSADGNRIFAMADNRLFTLDRTGENSIVTGLAGGASASLELLSVGNNQFVPLSHEGLITTN